ncbi:MAG: magnesium transporter, partial [Bacteroidota bacterium]
GRMPETKHKIERIKGILAHSVEHAKPLLKQLHPSDIAHILEDLSPDARKLIIRMLPVDKASDAISEMDEETRPEELLMAMSPQRAAKIIEELDPDDAADLLAQLPREDLRLIFERISDEEERVIQTLMTYDEDSAGGIMTTEVLKISAEMTKREAMEEVIRISEEMEDFYAIYVVDDGDILLGVVPLKSLIRARPWVKMKELVLEALIKVHVETDQEEVARKIQKYNLAAIPVVDHANRLLGRITFDDIMDVLEEESTEDILKIAGVSEDEELRGSWLAAVKSRIPWLLINLCTASLAGFVISRFSNTIDQLVIIASFMPIVAGVAGNGATQALAVTIRRIATNGIPPSQYRGVILKELSVGLVNGMLLGLIVGSIAYGLGGNWTLGLVVFLALIGNLLVAGFAGSAIPLLLQRLGVDPAVASSILMTAFTDILGYTLLLGLATLLLT